MFAIIPMMLAKGPPRQRHWCASGRNIQLTGAGAVHLRQWTLVAARLAGGSDLSYATAGKPDCYSLLARSTHTGPFGYW
jgi:hypothetical protein